jgi:hypothetical protein
MSGLNWVSSLCPRFSYLSSQLSLSDMLRGASFMMQALLPFFV